MKLTNKFKTNSNSNSNSNSTFKIELQTTIEKQTAEYAHGIAGSSLDYNLIKITCCVRIGRIVRGGMPIS